MAGILPAPATATDAFAERKLVDAVAFWRSYGAPETQHRARTDTRRWFLPKKRSVKRTFFGGLLQFLKVLDQRLRRLVPL